MTSLVPFHCVSARVAPIQLPLINRFYKRNGYLVHCGKLEQVYCSRATIDGVAAIVAAARFLPQESRYFLLRNLCVDQQWRQGGLARALMQTALQDFDNRICYCFAQGDLRGFYESLGFVALSQDNLPFDIVRRYKSYSQTQRGLLLLGFNA